MPSRGRRIEGKRVGVSVSGRHGYAATRLCGDTANGRRPVVAERPAMRWHNRTAQGFSLALALGQRPNCELALKG
jgi:hypothetical protein